MTRIRNNFALAAAIVFLGCSDSSGPSYGHAASVSRIESTGNAASWSQPAVLGSVINAHGYDNRSPAISTNGKTLYFGSDRPGGSGGLDLYAAHRDNPQAPWEAPQNLGNVINGSGTDNNAYPTPDGHDLFFTSTRPGGCGAADLWVSHREDVQNDQGWDAPIHLGCTINSKLTDSGPVYFADPETGQLMLFFGSTREGGQGSSDFYVSTLGADGTWGAPVIIRELNTPYDDNKLAIERDGLTVYLSSNRPGGGSGAAGFNIWVSTRATTQDAWSTPTVAVESAGLPAISTNGNSLYMVTKQTGTGVDGVPLKNEISVSTREH